MSFWGEWYNNLTVELILDSEHYSSNTDWVVLLMEISVSRLAECSLNTQVGLDLFKTIAVEKYLVIHSH